MPASSSAAGEAREVRDAGTKSARAVVCLDGTPWRWLQLSERRNIVCLVDADDWDFIVQWRWNWGWHRNSRHALYAKRNVGSARSTLYLHRELQIARVKPPPGDAPASRAQSATLAQDRMVVDHINGQSLDNRKANLRWLTAAENSARRVPFERIPSLDRIARGLVADWRAGRIAPTPSRVALEAIPF